MLIWVCRESEGIFEYGNYQKEADDLHAVVRHLLQGSRVASVILGHSKGVLVGFHDQYVKFYCYKYRKTYYYHHKLTLGLYDDSSLVVSKVIVACAKIIAENVITGGDVVLLYASKYHDIHTVVNVSGRYDLKKGIGERLGKDFMEIIKKEGFLDIKNKTGNL